MLLVAKKHGTVPKTSVVLLKVLEQPEKFLEKNSLPSNLFKMGCSILCQFSALMLPRVLYDLTGVDSIESLIRHGMCVWPREWAKLSKFFPL